MEYYCKICNKKYSSYQSLWKHKKIYHTNDSSEKPQNSSEKPQNSSEKSQNSILNETLEIVSDKNKLICIHCNKNYSRRDNMIRHEKKCKKKINLVEENILLKNELKEIKKQLKILINQQCKEHSTTKNKINKQLNINNNTNNINNNININIIQLGKEELHEVLTQSEQIDILENKQILENIIKYIHFNDKFPQFKNILITNIQNNIAYKYDEIENKFIATDKNDLINDLIEFSLTDLGDLLEKNETKLKQQTINNVHTIINNMDGDNIKFYENKKNNIKLLVYNNRNKITNTEPNISTIDKKIKI